MEIKKKKNQHKLQFYITVNPLRTFCLNLFYFGTLHTLLLFCKSKLYKDFEQK